MKTFFHPSGRERSFSELLAFLSECRNEARALGSHTIVNISLKVRRIDPLAVLESISGTGERHFYLEKNATQEAIAGAGSVVEFCGYGASRFSQARDFVEDSLSRSICAGDESDFSGPHFFCAFSFFDDPLVESPFPGVSVFLPKWQVARRGDQFTASANLRIDPESQLEPLAARVWRAHERFSSFDYKKQAPVEKRGRPHCVVAPSDENARLRFEETAARALELIETGRLDKIVLSRFIDVAIPGELNPLHAVNRLRMVYPTCFAYSVANGSGQSFIGASPELLIRRRGSSIETEALAGSAPRGDSASEDATFAEELIHSVKDNLEHRIVIESIRRRLKNLGMIGEFSSRPELVQLPNVQHLRTKIKGTAPDGVHLFDVLSELHPTPAVGGTPRTEACAAIRLLEDFERGLYAGAVGWVNSRGDGEFTAAIRSTQIGGANARVFAGAGLVKGSEPSREWEETEIKLRAVLEALK